MTSQRILVLVSVGAVVVCAAALGEERPLSNRQPSHPGSASLIAGGGEELRDGIQDGTVVTAGGPHMVLRPIRAIGASYTVTGNTITLRQVPANVVIEGYYGGWAPNLLISLCMELDPASFTNGLGAPLVPGQIPCSTTADCRTALGVSGTAPDLQCNDFAAGLCNHMFQEISRPDQIMGFHLPGCNQGAFACGNVTLGGGTPDPGADRYDMSAVIHVPAGATGVYEITFDEVDMDLTFLQISDGSLLTIGTLEHAFLNVLPDDVCVGGAANGLACSQHAECPSGFCHLKNRFISFRPDTFDWTTSAGIKVTLVNLDANSVANPAAYNGTVRWVGPPILGINDGVSGTFNAAALRCAFYAQDWSSIGRLHVYGAAVVPNSTYDVRTCAAEGGVCLAPRRVSTAKWGDVMPPLVIGQPNFSDIVAVVEKHKGNAIGPSKTRTKLREPVNPSVAVTALEVSACVDAFQGKPYKQGNATPPPTCP